MPQVVGRVPGDISPWIRSWKSQQVTPSGTSFGIGLLTTLVATDWIGVRAVCTTSDVIVEIVTSAQPVAPTSTAIAREAALLGAAKDKLSVVT